MNQMARINIYLVVAITLVFVSGCHLLAPQKDEALLKSPYKIINICFQVPEKLRDLETFDAGVPESTEVAAAYYIRLPRRPEIENLNQAKLDIIIAFDGLKGRIIARKLTGEPDSNVVPSDVLSLAQGDNGVYGWDCRGHFSRGRYLPPVKFVLTHPTDEKQALILSQRFTAIYEDTHRITMGDLMKDGSVVLTIKYPGNNGLLPRYWESCNLAKTACTKFEAEWHAEEKNSGKPYLLLQEIDS